jgi:hypothetical protein
MRGNASAAPDADLRSGRGGLAIVGERFRSGLALQLLRFEA